MELNGCNFILELQKKKLRTQISNSEKKTFKTFQTWTGFKTHHHWEMKSLEVFLRRERLLYTTIFMQSNLKYLLLKKIWCAS